MSIEIRCSPTENPWYLECDWGRFTNPEADPHKGLQHLMLIADDWLEKLLTDGPVPHYRHQDYTCCADHRDGRTYFTMIDPDGKSTIWELFEARWWDDLPCSVYLGRWPD